MRFRFRLIITIVLLIALSFGIGGTVLICASFNTLLERKTQAALDSYMGVRNTLYLLNSLGEQTDLEGITQSMEGLEGPWQALRLRQEEAVLFESGASALLLDTAYSPGAQTYAYVHIHEGEYRGLQIISGVEMGESLLLLEALFDTKDIYEARQTQLRSYFYIYLAVAALGILLATTLAYFLTKRLNKLTRTARRIAGGDLTTRSNIRSDDEFGQLSRDFDTMADQLQGSIFHLQSEMEHQEQFMGAFAHELKTPMTAIIGYADLLRQDGLEETTRLMAADYIYSEGQRLEKLSFKLLELLLLEKDVFCMHAVNLAVFLQEVEKALAPVMKKKGIRFVCRGERGKVSLEPDLVKSLLYNLSDNAAKAMDGEGIIAIRGKLIPGGCEFQVADNGRGMAREELSRITEAFYRVDKSRSRQQGGAGLGLALCKQIVRLHGGNLRFESAPGAGTRVTVTLYEGGDGRGEV